MCGGIDEDVSGFYKQKGMMQWKNPYPDGDMDYFSNLMKHFDNNLIEG